MTFPEITSTVELANADGTLNPSAVGWARHGTSHTSHLLPSGLSAAAELFRSKRWEYYGITGPDLILGLTIADLGYASVLQAYVRHGGETFTDEVIRPSALSGVVLPDTARPMRASGAWGGVSLDFIESPAQSGIPPRITLVAKTANLDARLELDYDTEELSTAFRISDTRYMFTVKAPAVRVIAGSEVKIKGKVVDLGLESSQTWAALDRGRGRWPYANVWKWGVAHGVNKDGKVVGLNAGAGWTDGAGTTENVVVVDGTLDGPPRGPATWTVDTKDFEKPWSVKADWIDATFTPSHHRHAAANFIIINSRTDQCFGTWSGSVTLHDGTKVSLDGLRGWAEDVTNYW